MSKGEAGLLQAAKIRKGDWPESFGFRPNSRRRDTEEEYLGNVLEDGS